MLALADSYFQLARLRLGTLSGTAGCLCFCKAQSNLKNIREANELACWVRLRCNKSTGSISDRVMLLSLGFKGKLHFSLVFVWKYSRLKAVPLDCISLPLSKPLSNLCKNHSNCKLNFYSAGVIVNVEGMLSNSTLLTLLGQTDLTQAGGFFF